MCARALHLLSSHTRALWGLGFTEALLLEQLDELLIGVPVEVYPLHLLVAVVEDDQVWVVMVNPLNIEALVILPLLVVFEERSKLGVGRVVQASARTALKASLGPACSATTQVSRCARTAHTHTHTHTYTRGRAREAGLRRLQIRATHHLALPLLGPAVRPSRRYKAVRGSRSLCLLRTDPDRSERHHPATASDGAQLLYTVRGTSGGCRTQPRIPSPWAESSTLREARRIGVARSRTAYGRGGDNCEQRGGHLA